jgi:hypothetical protein
MANHLGIGSSLMRTTSPKKQRRSPMTFPRLLHQDSSHLSHDKHPLSDDTYQAYKLTPLYMLEAKRTLHKPVRCSEKLSTSKIPPQFYSQHTNDVAGTSLQYHSSRFNALLQASEMALDIVTQKTSLADGKKRSIAVAL